MNRHIYSLIASEVVKKGSKLIQRGTWSLNQPAYFM